LNPTMGVTRKPKAIIRHQTQTKASAASVGEPRVPLRILA